MIPGSGRSPGEGNGYLFQCSYLENPLDRRAWQATVHRVAETDTTKQLILSFIYINCKYITFGLLWSSAGKESACNVGDLGSIPGLGRSPGGEHGNPLRYSCLENPYGQRSLVGYSPRGHKELDMTEQLSTAQHIYHLCFKAIYIFT